MCGIDKDVIAGFCGEAPPSSDFPVLGHASLCRVAGRGGKATAFRRGDLVVPTVRRNCPENGMNCRKGQSDMCLTRHYKEHRINGLHGFAREPAIMDHNFAVKVPESLSDGYSPRTAYDS